MIDLSNVQGFQWDDGNGSKSEAKHGVSRAEAEQVFFNSPLLLLDDRKHSQAETRYHAMGRTDDGRPMMIAFTLREQGTLIRVISARDMKRAERNSYHDKQT